MATKTYGQMCPVARSLDVLGERWTLLIIRELLLGSKRFKHLLASFPSLGPNRLSARLRDLEAADVVHKVQLPEPAEVTVYELTPRGEELREAVLALGRWGLGLELDPRIDRATLRADLIALSLTGLSYAPLDPARTGAVEFAVGREILHFRIVGGRYVARSGPSSVEPLTRVSCDLPSFLELAVRAITPREAADSGRLSLIFGDLTAVENLYDTLVYESAVGLPPELRCAPDRALR